MTGQLLSETERAIKNPEPGGSGFRLSKSDRSGDLTGTHTPGTNIHMAGRAIDDRLHTLHIGLPHPIGTPVRVGNLNAEHNALAAGHELPERNRKELKAMISRHMALISSLGNEENAIFRLRSIVPRYVRTLPGIRRLRQELCQCTSLAQLDTLLDEFLGQE